MTLPPPPPPPAWPQPAPPPPPPGARAKRPRWVEAVAVMVGGTLLVGAIAVLTGVTDSGPDHPDTWDPRVTALVEFVEDERGLTFDHPVHVDFLTAEEYSAQTTSDPDGLADEERAELDRYAAELRAFGLATGEVDLFEAFNAVSDAGTLAFYDPSDERIQVRGTEVTVGLKVTLVHELTHALQDQHFDLERLYDDDNDANAYTAFLGLVEGDAMRIEDAYVSSELDAKEKAAYEDEYAGELDRSQDATSEVPSYVSASFAVPYALGQPLVIMLLNDGGNDAVNEAFRSPPSTEEHLFDPASFLAHEGGQELDLGLGDDVELLDEGPFGPPSWYLLLAERIDPKVAFHAALGWAGDRFATFSRDDKACVRAVFAGDTTADEREVSAAVEEWASAMPGGVARAVEVDGHPGMESCDPGVEVDDPNHTGRSTDALNVPSLWGYLVADAASQLDARGARCYATAVLDDLTFEQISDPEGAAFTDPGFQDKLLTAFQFCR